MDYYSDILKGEDSVTRCKKIIADAERDLGRLSNGQCRDLLKDNTVLSREEIGLIVNFLRGH